MSEDDVGEFKIVFTGPMGAGKTTAIAAISEIAPVKTEVDNTDQAAHYLGLSRRFLQKLRSKGEGPLHRHHSTMVQYHIDDLQTWSQSQTRGVQS